MRSSDDAVPKEREIKIFQQSSASRPGGLDPPFVNNAAFIMRDSSTSYTIG